MAQMAEGTANHPEWMNPKYWPERRRAPGYPNRVLVPGSIVFFVAIPLAIFGFEKGWPALGCAAIALFLIGLAVIHHLTLGRFCCPQCGRRLPLGEPPRPGGFFGFHCRDCRIIWLTGVRVAKDDGGGADAGI